MTTEPALALRAMNREDLDAVVQNEQGAYDFPWSRSLIEGAFAGRDNCLVAVHDGVVVGHGIVSSVADEGHILNVCIARRWQGHGFGRSLLMALLEFLSTAGAATVFLEVRQSNHVAANLYDSVGFNEIGVRRGYYPAPGGITEDARILALTLTSDWPL